MTTANMNLTIPVVSQTVGPTWANQINGDLVLIDQHNHTLGSGVPVPVAGLNINGDLSFLTASGNFSITDLASVRFYNQAAQVAERAIYTKNDNLYYNTTGGTVVQITNGDHVNAGAGSITGMAGTTASVAYSGGTGVFTFEQSANVAATLNIGNLQIRPQTAGASAITLVAPAGTPAYTLTLPSGLPASQTLLGMTTTGVMNRLTIDGVTLVYNGTQIKVGTVSNANLAANSVNTTQLVAGSVTSEKLGPAVFGHSDSTNTYTLAGNGSWQPIYASPAVVSIVNLRPLVAVGQGVVASGFISCSTSSAEVRVHAYQNTTHLYFNWTSLSTGVQYAPSLISCMMDLPLTGNWTINVEVKQNSGSSTLLKNVAVYVYQI